MRRETVRRSWRIARRVSWVFHNLRSYPPSLYLDEGKEKKIAWSQVKFFIAQIEASLPVTLVSFKALYLCTLALWVGLHIFPTQRWHDEPQEVRNSCPLLRSYFIGSCHPSFPQAMLSEKCSLLGTDKKCPRTNVRAIFSRQMEAIVYLFS